MYIMYGLFYGWHIQTGETLFMRRKLERLRSPFRCTFELDINFGTCTWLLPIAHRGSPQKRAGALECALNHIRVRGVGKIRQCV